MGTGKPPLWELEGDNKRNNAETPRLDISSGVDDRVEDGGDEAPKVKSACQPCRPSGKEVVEHNLAHQPYRIWCTFCRLGKADNAFHRKVSAERMYSVISMNHMCMGQGSTPTLVAHEDAKGYLASIYF